ncbi:MAG: hypothetical protein WBN32_01380 [Woeseia sp.]
MDGGGCCQGWKNSPSKLPGYLFCHGEARLAANAAASKLQLRSPAPQAPPIVDSLYRFAMVAAETAAIALDEEILFRAKRREQEILLSRASNLYNLSAGQGVP